MPIIKLPKRSLDDMILPALRVTLLPGEGGGFTFVPDELQWPCIGITGSVNRSVFATYEFPVGMSYYMSSIDGEPIGPDDPVVVPGAQGGEFIAYRNGQVYFATNGQFSTVPPGDSRTTIVSYTIVVDGQEYSATLLVRVYNM